MNLKVHYEEYSGTGFIEDILLLPSISDVSTTEEWRDVARNLNERGGSRWRFVIPDWPGFGLSDRPRMDYTADTLESFLVDFISAANSPLGVSGKLIFFLISFLSFVVAVSMGLNLWQHIMGE